MTVHAIAWVALGGALGASGRYAVSLWVKSASGFPWATLSVNLLGSLLMGLVMGWLARQAAPQEGLRLFVAVGVLGGFTTFSAFSFELFMLLDKRALLAAAGYVLASLIGGLTACIAGYYLVKGA